MGYNLYGEPAWPNDILYTFPAVTLMVVSFTLGASTGDPADVGDMTNPSTTPLEIPSEQYFYFTFNLLRILPDRSVDTVSLAYAPLLLPLALPLENSSRPQGPLRRPLPLRIYLFGLSYSFWLGYGSLVGAGESLPLL